MIVEIWQESSIFQTKSTTWGRGALRLDGISFSMRIMASSVVAIGTVATHLTGLLSNMPGNSTVRLQCAVRSSVEKTLLCYLLMGFQIITRIKLMLVMQIRWPESHSRTLHIRIP